MKRTVTWAVVLLLAVAQTLARAEPAEFSGPVATDMVWQGTVLVADWVEVSAGAALSIKPGTVVSFRPGAGLLISGRLVAAGTAELPISFRPADPDVAPQPWRGLKFSSPGSSSLLQHCRVEGAQAIEVAAGAPRIANCEISSSPRGIQVAGKGTEPVIEDNHLHDLGGGGIECGLGSAPSVTRNRVERCGGAGISGAQGAVPTIIGNAISDCDTGIALQRTQPAIRGNTLRDNRIGISLNQVGGGRPVQDNRIVGGEIGILCENFSAPSITGNTVADSRIGIACVQGSSPRISGNRFSGNTTAISAAQISAPLIQGNEIGGSDVGIRLHLSSYATIKGNNFDRNRLHVELENMSSDWERRVAGKPMRGRAQQAARRSSAAGAGVPPASPSRDETPIPGAVAAEGNWWGLDTTREMDAKGPDADITGILDYHDTPTRSYEGYPGDYLQDRVTYAPWAPAPFPLDLPPGPPLQDGDNHRER